LLAPKFDLPLENITWRISLGDKWRVKHWSGSLQLQKQEVVAAAARRTRNPTSGTKTACNRRGRRKPQEFLALGNSSLEKGDPQQLPGAPSQAAYGLSTHDAAFNEDARVQLHNIKLQQALIGLNARQSAPPATPARWAANCAHCATAKR
jgi:hypothetical protein